MATCAVNLAPIVEEPTAISIRPSCYAQDATLSQIQREFATLARRRAARVGLDVTGA